MKSLEKRVTAIEQRYHPISIFADWCMERDPTWKGSDLDAFNEWLTFQQSALPSEREDPELNPDVGFEGSLHSNKL